MFDVVMPKMGESITEGTILEWKKQVGETIGKDETLLEISRKVPKDTKELLALRGFHHKEAEKSGKVEGGTEVIVAQDD